MGAPAQSTSAVNGHVPPSEPDYSINTFKPILGKLLKQADQFTPGDLELALRHLCSSKVSHAQTGSFLAAIRVTDKWRQPEMVRVIVRVLSSLAGKVNVGRGGHICDWTMTGESGLSVINVALPAAIVASGAGCRVVKHGYASSPWPSTPSSGDILTALSVPTTTLPPFSLTKVASSRHVPFLHIFTPRYSPQLAAISPLRRELGFETIFHVFAPLISAANPDYMVIGVHEERLGQTYAEACKTLGVKRAWIVHGKDHKLDAIAPGGETLLWDLQEDGQIVQRTITPQDFGAPNHPLLSVQLPSNGSAAENAAASSYSIHAKLIASLLSPRRAARGDAIVPPYEPDAYGTTHSIDTAAVEDFVCMNAAALLLISGRARTERNAMALARKSLREGRAYHALEALRDAAALAVDVDALEDRL